MSWQRELQEALNSRGFSTIEDFMAAHSGAPYESLAKQFMSPPLVLPVMLVRLQLEEARAKGPSAYRAALADSLARILAEHLPAGWGMTQSDQADVTPEFMNIAAFSTWTAIVKQGDDSADALFDRMWDSLQRHAPPGWRPASANDPVILTVIDEVIRGP